MPDRSQKTLIMNNDNRKLGGRCKLCGGDSAVVDSRCNTKRSIRRRRVCIKCQHRWTTYENDGNGISTPDLDERILSMEIAIVAMLHKFDEFKKYVSSVKESDKKIEEYMKMIGDRRMGGRPFKIRQRKSENIPLPGSGEMENSHQSVHGSELVPDIEETW